MNKPPGKKNRLDPLVWLIDGFHWVGCVLCPYQGNRPSLFWSKINPAAPKGRTLLCCVQGNVLIFDEAHNLLEAWRLIGLRFVVEEMSEFSRLSFFFFQLSFFSFVSFWGGGLGSRLFWIRISPCGLRVALLGWCLSFVVFLFLFFSFFPFSLGGRKSSESMWVCIVSGLPCWGGVFLLCGRVLAFVECFVLGVGKANNPSGLFSEGSYLETSLL